MLHAFIRRGDGSISQDAGRTSIAAAMADAQATFWVDMASPTDEELSLLDEVFAFHPLAIEDSIKYTQRPKIENYQSSNAGPGHDNGGHEGYFYMVFHGPDLETFRQRLRMKELDLFMSRRYLVTIHDEPMRSIDEVMERAKADTDALLSAGTDRLLHRIVDKIVDYYMPILDYLGEALDELEERALDRPDPSIVQAITARKRELLDLRRIVGPQREVVAQLTRGDVPFIREETRVYLRDVQDHLVRTVETVELYRDLVQGARDIYLSSISNHLNQIMKTLTIMSVIALPFTVVTSFFGMNFEAIPGLHSKVGFWIAVGFMAASVVGLLYLFKRKRWI
jgi:magnesium transporter